MKRNGSSRRRETKGKAGDDNDDDDDDYMGDTWATTGGVGRDWVHIRVRLPDKTML
jgi:hypothetical protein